MMHWIKDRDGNGINLTHAFAVMALEVERHGKTIWELQARGGTWWAVVAEGGAEEIKAMREAIVDDLISRTLDERTLEAVKKVLP